MRDTERAHFDCVLVAAWESRRCGGQWEEGVAVEVVELLNGVAVDAHMNSSAGGAGGVGA